MLENYTNEELIRAFANHSSELVRVLIERIDMLMHPPVELTDYTALQDKLF